MHLAWLICDFSRAREALEAFPPLCAINIYGLIVGFIYRFPCLCSGEQCLLEQCLADQIEY